jgi:ribosome-associated toxin RatA of RatAB toxin-antitoxin module
VPLENVKILDSKFLKTFISYCEETAEIDEEATHIKTQVFNSENGIKTRFAIANLFNDEKQLVKYLAIGISSKMLKENYFEGINKHTIQTIFNYINSTGIIEISKENFLNAKAVDIDFCIDFKLKETTFKDVFSICYDVTIPSKTIKPNLFSNNTNKGIQWGEREKVYKAYKTKQFLKYYAKLLELKNNSEDFYNAYLKDKINEVTLFADGTEYTDEVTEDNLLRIETTIKNPSHFETYGIYCKTLLDLLNIDLSKHSSFFNRPIQTYMSGYRPINHNSELTLSEKILIEHTKLKAASMNLQPMEVIDVVVYSMYPNGTNTSASVLKNQRSKFRKKIIELLLIDKKVMQENKKINSQKSLLEIQDFGFIPT